MLCCFLFGKDFRLENIYRTVKMKSITKFGGFHNLCKNKNIHIFKQISSYDCVYDCNWTDDDDAKYKTVFGL